MISLKNLTYSGIELYIISSADGQQYLLMENTKRFPSLVNSKFRYNLYPDDSGFNIDHKTGEMYQTKPFTWRNGTYSMQVIAQTATKNWTIHVKVRVAVIRITRRYFR